MRALFSSRRARRFLRHKLAVASVVFLLIEFLWSIVFPLMSPYGPDIIDLSNRYLPPSKDHLLGTDRIGRDVLSLLAYGGRISLQVIFIVGVTTSVIGTIIGLISGYIGGLVDLALQRVTEIIMIVPFLIVVLVFMTFMPPGLRSVLTALSLFAWPNTARIVRGEVLSIREEEYVVAAKALGASSLRILFKHIFPGCIPLIIINMTLQSAGFVLTEASLSYLGFGVQPPDTSWGVMLSAAQDISTLVHRPWLWLPPGGAIALTILALNFMGDGLRDALAMKGTKL